MPTRMIRTTAITMIAALLNLSLYQTAAAAVIGTGDAMRAAVRAERMSEVDAVLARADVQAVLVRHGVSVEEARYRVAALSEDELASLQQEFDELPAGGIGLFEALGITFLVLLLLEVTGVTNVFSKL